MGAPKQKWTAEEESALKAGIAKHGAGRWRTILKDPEFSDTLCLRSNVDLKDKWRNMCVMVNGYGSREKTKIVVKKSRHVPKNDDTPLALSTVVKNFDEEIIDVKPLTVLDGTLQIAGPKKKPTPKLDSLVLEAIAKLKEPTGSNKTAIAMYIEDNYWPPPDFKRWLSAELNALTASGNLIKVKRKYRIAPSSAFSGVRSSKLSLLEGRQREPSRFDKNDFKALTKFQMDAELARMINMTAEEAAAAAAQAVAVAEMAMVDAEEAAREAEAAEADAEEAAREAEAAEAEAAHAIAEAAMLTLKSRNAANLMVRV